MGYGNSGGKAGGRFKCQAVLLQVIHQASVESADIFQRFDRFSRVSHEVGPYKTDEARVFPGLKYLCLLLITVRQPAINDDVDKRAHQHATSGKLDRSIAV